MITETIDFESLMEARQNAITKSIRKLEANELADLIPKMLPDGNHPWRDLLEQFLEHNRTEQFYYAKTHDQIHVIYWPRLEKGVWFIPERGVGFLGEKALALMKETIDAL